MKVDWEGGLAEAILEYGLDEEDLDESDPELKTAVKEFRQAAAGPYERLNTLLRKYGE
ncbi:hypothetical protein [Mycobacteroides abscessus]|nr:hypothetical protein [Mycobacteroides abscessus]